MACIFFDASRSRRCYVTPTRSAASVCGMKHAVSAREFEIVPNISEGREMTVVDASFAAMVALSAAMCALSPLPVAVSARIGGTAQRAKSMRVGSKRRQMDMREIDRGDTNSLCEVLHVLDLFANSDRLRKRWSIGEFHDSYEALINTVFDDLRIRDRTRLPEGYLGLYIGFPSDVARFADALDRLDEQWEALPKNITNCDLRVRRLGERRRGCGVDPVSWRGDDWTLGGCDPHPVRRPEPMLENRLPELIRAAAANSFGVRLANIECGRISLYSSSQICAAVRA